MYYRNNFTVPVEHLVQLTGFTVKHKGALWKMIWRNVDTVVQWFQVSQKYVQNVMQIWLKMLQTPEIEGFGGQKAHKKPVFVLEKPENGGLGR